MSAKEEFEGRYTRVIFDGAEGNALWIIDPATEESTRIMLDEMPEFIEYLKYWMPGLFFDRPEALAAYKAWRAWVVANGEVKQ